MPAKYREHVGPVFMLSLGFDNCVRAYSPEEWKNFKAKIDALPDEDEDVREIKNIIYFNSAECEVDKQGRILIPQNLRDYAGLTQGVTIIGMSNCIDIWDSAEWNRKYGNIDRNLGAMMKKISAKGEQNNGI
jgi:MraZ protein